MKKLAFLLIFLLSLILVPLSCGGDGEGVEGRITWRLSHAQVAASTQGVTAQRFADMVSEATEGRLKVKVYPNSMLYGPYAEYEAVTTGAVECIMMNNYFARGILPYLNIMYVTLIWEDFGQVYGFLTNAEVNSRVRADLEEEDLYHLGMVPISDQMAFITTNREVRSIPEMEGLRFGVIAGSGGTASDAYARWVPIEVEYAERLTALSTGVIEITADTVLNLAAYRVWDYGGKHGLHGTQSCSADMFLANLDAWRDLPPDIQDIIAGEVMPQLAEDARQRVIEDDARAIEALREHLDTLHPMTPEDRATGWAEAEEYPATQKWLEAAGPDLVQLVEELRPPAP